MITAHGKRELNKFLVHLIRKGSNNKFIMEIEENHQILFLDILGYTIFRKNTRTSCKLNPKSICQTPKGHKDPGHTVTRTVRKWETWNTSLKSIILQNEHWVNNTKRALWHRKPETEKLEVEKTPEETSLPCVKGSIDIEEKPQKRHRIEIAFLVHKKIYNIELSTKTKNNVDNQRVYEITCLDYH